MKKLLFAIPLVILLAAACNKTTTVSVNSTTQSNSQTASVPNIPTSTPAKTITPVTNATSTNSTPANTYFTVPYWGIQFQVPSSLSDLEFATLDNTPNVLPLTTKSLVSLDQSMGGQGCAAEQGPLGAISRSSTPVNGSVSLIGVVDHYYYYYGGPQASCSTNTQVRALQSTQKTGLSNVLKTITAISK